MFAERTMRHDDLDLSASPAPEQVVSARKAAGLTQTEAAAAAGLGHYRRWGEYETGVRQMDASRFELFLLKHGLHPRFTLAARR